MTQTGRWDTEQFSSGETAERLELESLVECDRAVDDVSWSRAC